MIQYFALKAPANLFAVFNTLNHIIDKMNYNPFPG